MSSTANSGPPLLKLDNCKNVIVGDIPIPSSWNIQFRNLTTLTLFLFWFNIEIPEWIRTVTTVFKYMPELETLRLCPPRESDFQRVIKMVEISDVACKNLKMLSMSGYTPSRLFVTIGNQCSNLTSCRLGVHDINDDDLRALSQYQCLTTFSLSTPNQITNGLAYLTNLPHLIKLDIQYSFGRYINTRLLLDFSRYCPRLDIIQVYDRNCLRSPFDPRSFETEDLTEVFAVGAELRAYFEPRYGTPSFWDTERESSEWLEEYLIRIDHLRRDISLF